MGRLAKKRAGTIQRSARPKKSSAAGYFVRRHVKQSSENDGCGQACLQMLGAKDPKPRPRSLRFADLYGGDIVGALQSEWRTSEMIRSRKRPLPQVCVIKIAGTGGGRGHWVIKDGDRLHDPLEDRWLAWEGELPNRSGFIEIRGRR